MMVSVRVALDVRYVVANGRHQQNPQVDRHAVPAGTSTAAFAAELYNPSFRPWFPFVTNRSYCRPASPMHDHGKLARHSHGRLLEANTLNKLSAPAL